MKELRSIAHAVAPQEKFVLKILPLERIDNEHCRPSSACSEELKLDLEPSSGDDYGQSFLDVALALCSAATKEELIEYMQRRSRYALWNFDNI